MKARLTTGTAAVAAVAVSWLAAATAGASQLSVGSGSAFNLGSGTLNLGCASLLVAGIFDAASGSVEQALNVTIASSGTLDGGSGQNTASARPATLECDSSPQTRILAHLDSFSGRRGSQA